MISKLIESAQCWRIVVCAKLINYWCYDSQHKSELIRSTNSTFYNTCKGNNNVRIQLEIKLSQINISMELIITGSWRDRSKSIECVVVVVVATILDVIETGRWCHASLSVVSIHLLLLLLTNFVVNQFCECLLCFLKWIET